MYHVGHESMINWVLINIVRSTNIIKDVCKVWASMEPQSGIFWTILASGNNLATKLIVSDKLFLDIQLIHSLMPNLLWKSWMVSIQHVQFLRKLYLLWNWILFISQPDQSLSKYYSKESHVEESLFLVKMNQDLNVNQYRKESST